MVTIMIDLKKQIEEQVRAGIKLAQKSLPESVMPYDADTIDINLIVQGEDNN